MGPVHKVMKEGKYTYTNSQTLVMVFHLKDEENYISAFYIHLYMCVCIYIYIFKGNVVRKKIRLEFKARK